MDPVRWRQVCDLFDAALEREPAERSDVLAAVGDLDLRREVESLLAAHDAPGPLDRLAARMEVLRAEALACRLSGPAPAERGNSLTPGRRT